MKRFWNIHNYNHKYAQELEKALGLIKPYLIDAFTDFYGKNYRVQIAYVIEHLHYVIFLSENAFKLLKEENVNQRYDQMIQYYLAFFQFFHQKTKKIVDSDQFEREYIHSFVVASSFDHKLFSRFAHSIFNSIEIDYPFYTVYCNNEQSWKIIFLPLLAFDLEVLIHEINHAIMLDAVAYTDDEIIMPWLFPEEECDELFNDFISNQILTLYQKRGFPIPLVFRRFQLRNDYPDFFYLIDSFYYVFQNVIKESIMTKNFNLLREVAGKDDFSLFCSCVHHYYLKGGCTKQEFDFLNQLVLKMNDHAFSVFDMDYESTIHELERNGFKVRRLKKE